MNDEYPEVEFVLEITRRILGLEPQDFIPDHDYRITRSLDEKGVLIELFLPSESLAPVIGKGGNTANAIRELLRALGSKRNARYSLKLDRL